MKLIRTLSVSEAEFYDYFEQDWIANMKTWANREIDAKEITEGLCYCKRHEKAKIETEVRLLSYDRGVGYCLRIYSMSDGMILSYHTTPTKKGIEVTFEQSIESYDAKKHTGLMRIFSEGVYLGRMSDALYDMQKKIIEYRNRQS